jgi:hypothetical protein
MSTFLKSLGTDCIEKLNTASVLAIIGELVIEAERKGIKSPKPSTPLRGISPEGLPIWKIITKKYKKKIVGYKDPLEQWAAAIVLYRKICRKRGLTPFSDTVGRGLIKKSPSTVYLASYVDPALKLLQRIEKELIKANMLGKRQKRQFGLKKVSKDGTFRVLVATKVWRFPKKTSPASAVARFLMPKYGFKKESRNTFAKKFGPKVKLSIRYSAKASNTADIFINLRIPGKVWKSLEQTQKKPDVYIKNWVKRGFKAKAKALDTGEEIYNTIQEFYPANSTKEISNLLNKITLPVLVNVGDEFFQNIFAKYLVDKALAFDIDPPEYLVKFVNKEEYRTKMRHQHGVDIPEGEDEGTKLSPEILRQ